MLASFRAAFESPSSEGLQQRPPRYADEDTTPTSDREILGWYAYGIAAEVFAVCGVGLCRPTQSVKISYQLDGLPRIIFALDTRATGA